MVFKIYKYLNQFKLIKEQQTKDLLISEESKF